MKKALRLLIICLVAFVVAAPARGVEEQDESFSKKLRDFFVRTPTPMPSRKKRKTTATQKKKTPTPSPSAAPTPSPSATQEPEASPMPTTPRPAERPTPGEIPKPSETPTPAEMPTPAATPKRAETSKPGVTPSAKKHAANATITSDEIVGYENYPAEVRKIIDTALPLTAQNLGYKYGSADPANGGMDCSGFIYYVLSKNGIADVPRDAREQYIWVRKAGNFQAVLGHSDDTFELDALKPGDLLFWAGTYSVNRDPDITHTMIYLGREKASNQRIMVGASDGRTYKGQSRFGVSVFDFKVSRLASKADDKPGPIFVGYGRIPGLKE
jgi:cell wall-associated NlpC family hydrolase